MLLLGLFMGIVFFPRIIINFDEYFYAGEAFTLSKGRFVPTPGDPLPAPPWLPVDAMKYPLGWPILLAAARLWSFRAMYLVTLAAHMLAAAAMARMLVRRGLPSWLSAVYFFHPALLLYSRTLLSDAPVAALTVLAMDAWEGGAWAASAGSLAFTTVMRFASLVPAFGFFTSIAMDWRSRRNRAWTWLVAFAAAAGVLLAAQFALTPGSETSRYSQGIRQLITGRMWTENLLLYMGGLLLLPPFSLAASMARPARTDRWALAAVPPLAFLVFYSFHDTGRDWLQTLVGGQRLLLPAHAALMVATSQVWGGWLKRHVVSGLACCLAMGLAVSIASGRLADRYSAAVEAAEACSPRRLGYNLAAGRVAASVRAERYFVVEDDSAPEVDLLLFSPRQESNRPTPDVRVFSPARRSAAAHSRRLAGGVELYDLTGRCPEGWGKMPAF